MMGEEIWKDIKGYEELYQVSNFGRVKSLERKGAVLYTGGQRVYRESIKTEETIKDGYKRVNLYKDGKLKKFLVHRLVAEAFLSNLETKTQVNHINGKTDDNRLENLEWTTVKENSVHKTTVLNKKPRGVYKGYKGWSAQIVYEQKKINLGNFSDKKDAYKAFYDKYVELRGVPPWDLSKYQTH